MADSGSKGSASPHPTPTGEEGAPPASDKPAAPAAPADGGLGEPTVKVPVVWVAIGQKIADVLSVPPGLNFQIPNYRQVLADLGDKNSNAMVYPVPKEIAEPMELTYGRVKVVKGKRASSIILYDAAHQPSDYLSSVASGQNRVLWAEYCQKHQPVGIVVPSVKAWKGEIRVGD